MFAVGGSAAGTHRRHVTLAVECLETREMPAALADVAVVEPPTGSQPVHVQATDNPDNTSTGAVGLAASVGAASRMSPAQLITVPAFVTGANASAVISAAAITGDTEDDSPRPGEADQPPIDTPALGDLPRELVDSEGIIPLTAAGTPRAVAGNDLALNIVTAAPSVSAAGIVSSRAGMVHFVFANDGDVAALAVLRGALPPDVGITDGAPSPTPAPGGTADAPMIVPSSPALPPLVPLVAEFLKPVHASIEVAPLAVSPRLMDSAPAWTPILKNLFSLACSAGLVCSAAATAVLAYGRRRRRTDADTTALPTITGPRGLA
jgi:hypothetical protein